LINHEKAIFTNLSERICRFSVTVVLSDRNLLSCFLFSTVKLHVGGMTRMLFCFVFYAGVFLYSSMKKYSEKNI
jgi:hypothetical protein